MKHKRLVVKYKNEKFSSKMFGLSPNVPYFEIMDCNENDDTSKIVKKWLDACHGNPHFPSIDEKSVEVIYEECFE